MATGEVDIEAAATAAAPAALAIAGSHLFGAEPGRIPVVLHQAYGRARDDGTRARLAAALARCWAYAGEPARAAPFATAAIEHAAADGDPAVLADALDAELTTHWGPGELMV